MKQKNPENLVNKFNNINEQNTLENICNMFKTTSNNDINYNQVSRDRVMLFKNNCVNQTCKNRIYELETQINVLKELLSVKQMNG